MEKIKRKDPQIGQRFGRWTVSEGIEVRKLKRPDGRTRTSVYVKCFCDCGQEKMVSAENLKNAATKSCGCLRDENSSNMCKAKMRHGESDGSSCTTEYRSWTGMKARCLNSCDKDYHRYGGRGVLVDARWIDSYETFLADMGRKPGPKYSIDRIDFNGPYSAENCRWADSKQQNNNRRSTILLDFSGDKRTIAELSVVAGIGHDAMYQRIKAGWSIDRIIATPLRITFRRKAKMVKQ